MRLHYCVIDIGSIENTFDEKLKLCTYVENWVWTVRCGGDTVQKYVVLPKYFSSFQKLCQCVIKLQMKMQITQQHNKSKLKKYLQNKRNNCQGQSITVPLQKKIIRRIS